MQLTQRDLDHFRATPIERSPDGCWIWRGDVRPGRGPVLRIHKQAQRGLLASAKEISWQLQNGHVPMDQQPVSTCSNDLCINPAHMVLVPLV